MKIATWNCNSIRARLDYCREWLDRDGPDVLCLQETKIEDSQFPVEAFRELGYEARFIGQKTYNGVATLYRAQLETGGCRFGLEDEELDEQKRALALSVGGIEVINLYVPNGRALDHPDYARKLRFLARLRQVLEQRHQPDDAVVVCGDFNVTQADADVHDPAGFAGQLLCSEPERSALGRVLDWGLTDAYRERHQDGDVAFSWWDYRGAAFRFNQGLRIDLILLTAPLLQRCQRVEILRDERKVKGKERWKPSDHAPVVVTLDD